MQCRFWFPHLCTLSLVKLLFRRCFDRKTQNEICKTRDSAIGERVACKNALVDVARDYFLLLSFLTDIYLFFGQKCKNEIAHLQELHWIRKGECKHELLKKDHERLEHCRIELVELKHRHQLAMQRYTEVATPIRYSITICSRKIQRDPMETMRTYTITKSRDHLQYHDNLHHHHQK